MRIIRITTYAFTGLLLCLVLLFFGGRGYHSYRAWSLSRAFASAHPDLMSQPAADRVVVKARQIAERIDSTRYSHFTSIDESAGRYVTDCSGLACYLLRNAAPKSYQALYAQWCDLKRSLSTTRLWPRPSAIVTPVGSVSECLRTRSPATLSSGPISVTELVKTPVIS